MAVRCPLVPGVLEQKIGNSWSPWLVRDIRRDRHHHPVHAERLGSGCRVSGNGGGRFFSGGGQNFFGWFLFFFGKGRGGGGNFPPPRRGRGKNVPQLHPRVPRAHRQKGTTRVRGP